MLGLVTTSACAQVRQAVLVLRLGAVPATNARSLLLQGVHVLISRTHGYLTRQNGFCSCSQVQDFEMGRLSWVVWVSPV